MRLTEKVELFNGVKTHKKLPNISQQEMVIKLGQLEDLEEELGVDLITLFKALKNPIYVKSLDETIWCSNRLYGGLNGYFMAIDKDTILYPQDYGKTWALTKEDLK